MISGKTTGLTTGTDTIKNTENVFGSTKADSITGNSVVNTFTGNGGADTYSFLNKQAFGAATSDKITDFSSDDKILLSRSAFGIALTATLSCATVSGTTSLNTALSTANFFVYDTSTGNIYWNQNGTTAGAGTGGIFAVLTNRFATFSAANLGLVA
jgi:serralysin